jgi:hypothetical protein
MTSLTTIQADKEIIAKWEQGNSVLITSELSLKPGAKKRTAKVQMTVGSIYDVARATAAFWNSRGDIVTPTGSRGVDEASDNVVYKKEASE